MAKQWDRKTEISRAQQNPDGPIKFGGLSFGTAVIIIAMEDCRVVYLYTEMENGVWASKHTFHMFCLNQEVKTEKTLTSTILCYPDSAQPKHLLYYK